MSRSGRQGVSVQLSLHSDFKACNLSVGVWNDTVWEKGQARGRDGQRALGGETEEIKQRQKARERRRERENISARSEPWPELVIQTYQPSSPLFSWIETILPLEHGPFPNHRNNTTDSWLTENEKIRAEPEAHSSSHVRRLLRVVFIRAHAHTSSPWHSIRDADDDTSWLVGQ